MLASNNKIQNEDRPTKRKAFMIENTQENSLRKNNKRVSFGKVKIIDMQPKFSDPDEELSELAHVSNKSLFDPSNNKLINANIALSNLLLQLSNSIGVHHELNESEIEKAESLYAEELKLLEKLETENLAVLNTLKQQENELSNGIFKLKEQETLIENSIKDYKNDEKMCLKKAETYKNLLENLGITLKSTTDDHLIEYNTSSFIITPTSTSYLLTPNHDKLLLFTKGTHKICKTQLKYLTYRLIDN